MELLLAPTPSPFPTCSHNHSMTEAEKKALAAQAEEEADDMPGACGARATVGPPRATRRAPP